MKNPNRKSVLKRIVSYLRPYSMYAAFGVLSLLVLASITLYLPLLLGQGLIDEVLVSTDGLKSLNVLALHAIVLYLVKGLFSYAQHYSLAYLGHAVVRDIRKDLLSRILYLPLGYHQNTRKGEIISKVTSDINNLQNAVGQGLGEFINQVVTGVGILVIIFVLNYRLALTAVLVLPVIAFLVWFLSKKLRFLARQVQAKLADISASLQEVLSGIRVVKAYRAENKELEHLKRENNRSFAVNMKSTRIMAGVLPLIEIVSVIGILIVIWHGSNEVIEGRISAGTLVSFVTYLGMASGPITSLSRVISVFQQALASAERVFELIDEPEEFAGEDTKKDLVIRKGKIEFDSLSFSYENEEVLHQISFTIEPGEVVALVGPSGSGKTTIANLLMRFYNPDRGRILIDDCDLGDVTLNSLRSQIGLVPQETFLFAGTVYESIAYGKENASFNEVQVAAKQANAHDFILQLPKAYDTVIGEEGTNLSGGQRQRIALARAILKDPKILILDEATSSLDAESEKAVQEGFDILKEGRTSLVIAHRLSTIKNADRILVLKDGCIAESGTHEQLLNLGGLYYRLYSMTGSTENGVLH
ncbi:MAG: ABC transporter ATP-binding protein [Firmicutes bacterium]|nr:ABC transporter ATP-binding protein [Bacillota bacterium]